MFDQIRDVSLEAVSALLAFFYSLPVVGGSYGVAIILLTVAVMVILMPLTLKATRSTIKMTQLQPELKRLQKEYKDDRQALNEQMMALYQNNGVNPVGGCLPMLAQLPVFLLLFNVLRGLSRRVSDLPYYTLAERAQEISGAAPDVGGGETFAPQYLSQDSELYQSLSEQTEIGFLRVFDLAVNPWDVLTDNVISAIPYLLLILFVVASSYYQQKQISSRRGAQPDNPTPQQQTQQQLLRILPLMSGIWSFLFPAGLVLYWATSNLFRIGQQAYISRSLYTEEAQAALAAASKASSEIDDKPSGKKSSNGKGSNGDGKKSDTSDDGSSSDGAKAGVGGRSKNAKGGSNSGNGSAPADRNEAWARRRAERAKTKPKQKPSPSGGGSASGRVTPKGTKPTDGRKKRKR
ncbi:MAG: YidC/Oxa1 family membrane protein insertase [Actinomycetota bacterium]